MKEIHAKAKANATHTHTQSDIAGLADALKNVAGASHTHAQSDITGLSTTLSAKAPLASPTFTGTPKAPTAEAGNNTTQVATTAFVTTAVSSKQPTVTGGASSITSSDLTASRALVSSSNGKVAVSDVTSTELGYLDGVTSNIQTQINGKQAAISGTANAVMITDANGKPTVSTVITVSELNKLNGLTPTTTELNYMDGVTSKVQEQIDNAVASGALIGEIKWLAHNKNSGFYGAYLLCDGRAVSRTEYADLFAFVGTDWGAGDGSTTFNLPNFIGRTVWGATVAGEYKESALPNIKGSFQESSPRSAGSTNTAGVFNQSVTETQQIGDGEGINCIANTIDFDASRCSGVYKDGVNIVQPPAATLRPMIRYKL